MCVCVCVLVQWQAMRAAKLMPSDNWDNMSDILLYKSTQTVRPCAHTGGAPPRALTG